MNRPPSLQVTALSPDPPRPASGPSPRHPDLAPSCHQLLRHAHALGFTLDDLIATLHRLANHPNHSN